MAMSETLINRLPTGSKVLDGLLGGGFEAGTISQLFGEPASGKTNICLQLAVNTLRAGKRVVYIDTEGFSVERFQQIAGEDAQKLAQKLIHFKPTSFEEQYVAVKETEKIVGQNVGLIILDSATAFYRVELESRDSMLLKRELANQATILLGLARKYDIAVVITNQIYMDVDKEELRAVGGNMLEHISKVIVQLSRTGIGTRQAVLRKHRSMAEGQSAEFRITANGVE
ncbi:DNA repair and recombination protein RadB [Methanocella paludicola SANAE]|uniref:DNA repair and recombination protein RadB n=1 Tax=Methanocella paludicola (strain DSM 17711 / JCM 13418 / NBRC 101707 / SANAE) TaxID=304371 RepID=D1Z2H6_METPS|nr:DNA repair and recombination protein RadB [Methanocella paludicola SANAE]